MRGAAALITDNETNNIEILALNDKLGYQRVGGELRLARSATTV